MAITDLENAGLAGTEFVPFNDTDQPRIEQAIKAANVTSGGMDTTIVDPYREGVYIRTSRHRFNSTQPKLWAGNLNHYVKIQTIGQARSFTEYDNSMIFVDQPISVSSPSHPADFNPVQYIQDSNYPFPIKFNNGPQQEEEAIIEPFTIKFRRPSIEGTLSARSVKGSLEDGNTFDSENQSANRIEQFISFTPPSKPRFFLDEGEAYFGEVIQPGFLTTRFDPVALYPLNEFTFVTTTVTGWVDVTNTNPNLVDADISTPVSLRPGPFPESYNNPRVADFNSTHLSASEQTPNLQIIGDMSAECFFLDDVGTYSVLFSQNVSSSVSSPDNNTLFQIAINVSASLFEYLHQYGSGSIAVFSGTLSSSVYKNNNWNHIGFTRAVSGPSSSVTFYLNGINIGNANLPAPTGGQNTILTVGGVHQTTGGFNGGISSLKIVNRVLSNEEMVSESERLLKTIYDRSAAVVLEGFTPVIIREVEPYNEVNDERIVERIRTTDPEFIGVLKSLKYDLDNDIRESFDKKSATAGNDVYGPNSGWVGTDSIAFVGRIKGA